MSKVYVGNLDSRINEKDLEVEFGAFGTIRGVWVARKPPGYGFVEFEDKRDALDSIRELDGKNQWRVELAHSSRDGDGGRGLRDRGRGGSERTCYECGEPGHFARDCRGGSKRRSPSPRYRRSSPDYGRRSRSPRARKRSYSPRGRARSDSRSPRSYKRRDSPSYAPVSRDRRSRS